jgi:hypothetical protein
MRPVLSAIALCVAASLAPPAHASPTSDALGACLVDKSTGHDRKVLARWIFVAMSVHPELHDIFDLTQQTRDAANQGTADIFTRLVTVDCVDETRAAFDRDGAIAMKLAFGKLGEVAMQELISNPAVQASFEGIDKYLDKDKLRQAFGKK